MTDQKKSLDDQLAEEINNVNVEEDDMEQDEETQNKNSINLLKGLNEDKEEKKEQPRRKPGRPPKNKKEDEDKIEENISSEQTYKIREQLDRNMLVPVASFVFGKLIYNSLRTGAVWRFTDFGAKDEVELYELQSMKSSRPRFLTEPWLIILDDKVVDHLGLSDLYEKILKPQNLDKLFKARSSVIRSILEDAPIGMKKAVCTRAAQLIAAKKLDSRSRINAIEETCGVDLSE